MCSDVQGDFRLGMGGKEGRRGLGGGVGGVGVNLIRAALGACKQGCVDVHDAAAADVRRSSANGSGGR